MFEYLCVRQTEIDQAGNLVDTDFLQAVDEGQGSRGRPEQTAHGVGTLEGELDQLAHFLFRQMN